jgi:cob(I)alamin adenosyltransferase
MMRHDQHLEEIQTTLFDAMMELDCKSQQASKKAVTMRHLRVRRAIEERLEQERLNKNLKEYDFD